MAVKFDDIRADFLELKGFVLSDLEIITSAPGGGNYAAALLITTACEALGTVRYGKKDEGVDFFRDYLLPEKWRPVGKSIYDALTSKMHEIDHFCSVLLWNEKMITCKNGIFGTARGS